MEEVMQGELNGVLPMFGKGCGLTHFAKLNFCHDPEHMFLAFEIVEERAFADVGGLGNIFDCDVGESAFGKELEGAAEKTQAGFRGAALAAAHVIEMRQIFSEGWFWKLGKSAGVTVAHK
jgi:hypothetical protein